MITLPETLTNMADLLCDISSNIREIPHGQKAVKTRALLCFLHRGTDIKEIEKKD